MRDSGLPADVLVGKLEKDISLALRQGMIAQVTTLPSAHVQHTMLRSLAETWARLRRVRH
jgi:hypothetical protein